MDSNEAIRRRKPDWWYQVCEVRDKLAAAEMALSEADDLLFRALNPQVPEVPHGTLAPQAEAYRDAGAGPPPESDGHTADNPSDAAVATTAPPTPATSPSPGQIPHFHAVQTCSCVPQMPEISPGYWIRCPNPDCRARWAALSITAQG